MRPSVKSLTAGTRDRLRLGFINQPWNSAVPPVDNGSVAIWTYQVSRLLATEADVAVVSRRVPETKKAAKYDGVDYLRVAAWPEPFGLIAKIRRSLFKDNLPRFAAKDYYLAYFRHAACCFVRWCPDVIHVHNFFQALPTLRDKHPKAHIVLHMHCEWLSQLPKEYIRQYLLGADWVVTCSDHIRETLVDTLPEWVDSSSTLPNGVDTTVFSASGDTKTGVKSKIILFVGRISPEKGLHVLMEAFQPIADRFNDATLLVVGPEASTPAEFMVDISSEPVVKGLYRFYGAEPYLNALRKQVPDHLTDRVRFIGAVSHPEVRDYFRNAAVLVNPSLSESFGMSVIEAMACGCPVVVAETGGMKGIVQHKVNGLVVSPNDSDALAESVIRILTDSDLARSCAVEGRKQAVEFYDWSKIAAQTLKLYRQFKEK